MRPVSVGRPVWLFPFCDSVTLSVFQTPLPLVTQTAATLPRPRAPVLAPAASIHESAGLLTWASCSLQRLEKSFLNGIQTLEEVANHHWELETGDEEERSETQTTGKETDTHTHTHVHTHARMLTHTHTQRHPDPGGGGQTSLGDETVEERSETQSTGKETHTRPHAHKHVPAHTHNHSEDPPALYAPLTFSDLVDQT